MLVAITGTNGKSTTTALTGALCEASGRPTFCGGNLGNMPLIDAVDHEANIPGGLIVAEVAGFMLEMCTSFRPRVGACLNISEDHLDRYGTMDVYASMKTRVFNWLTADDFAVANAGDQRTVDGAEASPASVHLFAGDDSTALGAFMADDDQTIVVRTQEREERYPVEDLPLIGGHNLENAMAAYLIAQLCGVDRDAVRAGARSFVPQKHRMELVGEHGGVSYYDDSKGTNVAAVAASVRGFPRPLVLIAGGVDKGGSYEPMFAAMDGVAKGLILIGEAAPLIRAAAGQFGVTYPVVDAGDLDQAVAAAAKLASAGDAVVLSPACASYDMFDNFGQRGMAFRQAVLALNAD